MKKYTKPKHEILYIIKTALDLGELYGWYVFYDGERYPNYLSMANSAEDAVITIDDDGVWLETKYGRGLNFPEQIPESELVETIKKYSY